MLLLDDVISSGATIRCIAQQMVHMDIELVGVQAILAKGGHYQQLETDIGVPVRFLSKV
ncbi:adenine phosphoribosyltransferase [compost metagenome]